MNHPARPLREEVARIAAEGAELVEITLEPPGAWPVDGEAIRGWLEAAGLPAVGHTAPYLPLAAPFDAVREAAIAEFTRVLDAFALAGVTLVNLHPDGGPKHVPREASQARLIDSVARLAEAAAERGQRLMVENLGWRFNEPETLRPLLEAVPELGFHLDVGHAHMNDRGGGEPRLARLLAAFGERLAHVHAHDNLLGGQDLHLPLGAGRIDWPEAVGRLRAAGWDGPVTLEIFSRHPEHARTSMRLWREWWERAG